jgi:hypothetical protein
MKRKKLAPSAAAEGIRRDERRPFVPEKLGGLKAGNETLQHRQRQKTSLIWNFQVFFPCCCC